MDEGNVRTRAFVAFGAAAVAFIIAVFMIVYLVGSSNDAEVPAEVPVPTETVE